ncbi:MAG: aspartate aminotransferase family protein [Candidatus Acidoferrales bacterium]
MSLAAVRRAENALLVPTYDRFPVLFRRGRGCTVYDADGRPYLDFLSGIGVNALGYGHPAIQRALRRQAKRLIHVSNLFYHDYQAALARRLKKISGLDRVFFTNSGTEAIEGALKLARVYARLHSANGRRPRWRVLALENSFHGRTFAALAATGQKKYRAPFAPLVPGVRFVRFNDVGDLERKFDSSVCAILLEPIQGEGGIRSVSLEFFMRARALTRRRNALLIADEIQCGLGRTGRYFAYQLAGVQPDVVTVAKPLAAGLPLGAILARERVALALGSGSHGTTFGGGPLVCAVALAFLETLERERLLAHVRQVGGYFRGRLEELQKKYDWIREVRGAGLMLAMELGFPGKAVVREALARGVLINCTHDTVLRFLPPYIIEERHVERLMRTLEAIFARVDAERRSGKR